MDMQTPDHSISSSPADPAGPLPPAPSRCLRRALAATVPTDPTDSSDTRDEKRQAAQVLFDSLHPGDPADALLAVIAIAAGQAAIDSFARATRPDTADETAVRLRSGGLAAGRAYTAWLRTLRKPQPAAAQRRPAAAPSHAPKALPVEPERDMAEVPPGFITLQPGAKPIPAVETFQPRDRFGEPIPDLRTDQMTRAQLRASLAIPRDPSLEAEALAEEAAMMAEQAAMDAAAKTATG
jgi:hypothetical protein